MSNRDDVDTVRSRTDILDVVAPYVALKRSGRIWKGLCPFHNEKTPSFQVNPELGRWHCFGQCAEGGDIYKFLQKVDNLTFPEALERLALKAGVTLTREAGYSRESVPVGEKDRLYGALNAAVTYYSGSLQQNSQALNYLIERGITPKTIQDYQLGFAGGDWDTLPRYLDQVGVAREDAVRAGILVASERGGHYDKLRGRIVFPIVDVQNRTVAFGGRLIHSDPDRPKYLNSAETPLFSKSKTLYGLSRARKAITDIGEAVIVEGYLDVITCHQSGFLNAVATLGTSLTEEHAGIIGKLARRVLLAFDADTAGVKAAQRATAILEAQEIEVRIIVMAEGEDPDSLIKSGRSDDFQRAIKGALPVPEYQLKQILASTDPNLSERDRTTLFQRDILPILKATKSVVERERYVQMCSVLHPFYSRNPALAADQIRSDVDGPIQPKPFQKSYSTNGYRRSGQNDSERSFSREPKQYYSPPPVRKLEANALEKSEETIIQALLDPQSKHRELLGNLDPALFIRPAFEQLARILLSMPPADGIKAALEDTSLANDPTIARILFDSGGSAPELTTLELTGSLKALKRHSEEPILEKLREMSRDGNPKAMRLYTKLMRERNGIVPDQNLST
jgi:DNA primase catalytic core